MTSDLTQNTPVAVDPVLTQVERLGSCSCSNRNELLMINLSACFVSAVDFYSLVFCIPF